MASKLILIFIDGIGIGDKNSDNPLYLTKSIYLSHFKTEFKKRKKIIENGIIYSLDASLGIDGIPQSATGQTSAFTGRNAAKILGHHLFGFPSKTLRSLLIKNNLLLKFKQRGLKVKFINAYTNFSDELSQGLLQINQDGTISTKNNKLNIEKYLHKISVTTIIALSIKQRFYGLLDLKDKKTVYHDFTNRYLIERNIDIKEFSPETAAKIILNNSKKYDVILYEYFLTDKIGHKQSLSQAIKIVEEFNLLLDNIVKSLDLNETNVIIFSDHGNFEDLSTKKHTNNDIPFIHIGKNIDTKNEISSIEEIYNYILKVEPTIPSTKK